jgi:hypothetical protein
VLVGTTTLTTLKVEVPSFSSPGVIEVVLELSKGLEGEIFTLKGGIDSLQVEMLSEECHL